MELMGRKYRQDSITRYRDSDLNSYMEGVEEQVGIRTMDDSCYIERYGMEQPGHGASLYKYTFLKITDTNLQLEDEIKYRFGATDGECTVNGTNYYTGNTDDRYCECRECTYEI